MSFAGNKHVNHDIVIRKGNNVVGRETSAKFLGIMIDEKLVWKAHFNYIHNKVSTSSGIVLKVKDYLNRGSFDFIL